MWSLLTTASKPPRAKGELPPLLLRLTNFLGYLLLISVNILSSSGAFGATNAEVSAKFPTPLTPAGWAFAIWGLIFILEGMGVVYQVLSKGYREGGWKTDVVNKIGYGWQVGWLFQNLWQIVFVRESILGMWLSAVALLGALVSFQFTLHRLNGTTQELRARGYAALPASAYICYKLPTSMNAAWLSVATVLGLLIVPVSYGVEQRRLIAPAAVLTVAVTAGGVWRLLSRRDAAYGLTLIWALSAVASNNSGNVPTAVKVVGIVCLVVLALFVVSALVRTRRELSTATAATAMGVSGSLLYEAYSTSYGPYGDQRMLLSDSYAPAGYGHNTSGDAAISAPASSAIAGGPGIAASGYNRASAAEGVASYTALDCKGAVPSSLSDATAEGPGWSQQPGPLILHPGSAVSIAFREGREEGEFVWVPLGDSHPTPAPHQIAGGTWTQAPALGSEALRLEADGMSKGRGAAGERRVRFADEGPVPLLSREGQGRRAAAECAL